MSKHATKKSIKIQDDLKADLANYKLILSKYKDGDLDIPPKRYFTSHKKTTKRITIQKNRTHGRIEGKNGNEYKKGVLSNSLEFSRPAYLLAPNTRKPVFGCNTRQTSKFYKKIQKAKSIKYENYVMINYSYEELIRFLKDGMNKSEDRIDQQSIIEPSFHWKMLPKNIESEMKRFDISDHEKFGFLEDLLKFETSPFGIQLYVDEFNEREPFSNEGTDEKAMNIPLI